MEHVDQVSLCYSWRRRISGWVFFTAVQVGLALVIIEVAARLFNPWGIAYFPEVARYFDTMIIEEPIGYRHRPGLKGRYYCGSWVEINSLGLRDREIDAAKPDDEFRILVMGDSIPFGVGVDFEDSIPHQLEVIANQQSDRQRYRTVNMGVPSYNTEQELVQLKTVGVKLKPDLVVLIFVRNDIEPKMWVFDKRKGWLTNFCQRSYAASLLFTLSRQIEDRVRGKTTRINAGAYQPDHPRWRAIDRSMTQIHEICHSAGIPLVVVTKAKTESTPFMMVSDLGQREGFPVHHLAPVRRPDQAGLSFSNSKVDSHPNKIGSHAHALALHKILIDEGLIE